MRTSDLQLLETRLTKSLSETVVLTVNGKMDKMQKALDDHIAKHEAFDAEVRPILEAYQGSKVLGNFIKWVASVGIAILALKSFLP